METALTERAAELGLTIGELRKQDRRLLYTLPPVEDVAARLGITVKDLMNGNIFAPGADGHPAIDFIRGADQLGRLHSTASTGVAKDASLLDAGLATGRKFLRLFRHHQRGLDA